MAIAKGLHRNVAKPIGPPVRTNLTIRRVVKWRNLTAAGTLFRATGPKATVLRLPSSIGECSTVNDFDDQFNLRRRHPIGRTVLLLNLAGSLLAQTFLTCSLDIPYGESAGQKLDIFPAGRPEAPVFVFIHGGYFRSLDKSQYRYLARRMAKLGHTTVLVNYDLAPTVPVSEIIRQVISSFQWIGENIHRWNGDRGRIVLCGHSVGAILAVKILQQDWPGGSGIRKAALLSGLYDLGPMKRSYLNMDLHLTDNDVCRMSPMFGTLAERPDILIAAGGNETHEFIAQSKSFSAKLKDDGIPNDLVILPGINHYSMSRLLAGQRNRLMDWLF